MENKRKSNITELHKKENKFNPKNIELIAKKLCFYVHGQC